MGNFNDGPKSVVVHTGKLKMHELSHYPMESNDFNRRPPHNLCGFLQGVSVLFFTFPILFQYSIYGWVCCGTYLLYHKCVFKSVCLLCV